MFSLRPAAVAVLAATMLAGCGGAVIGASAERDADTDALMSDLSAGRYDAIVARMSQDNSPEEVRAQLPFLKTMVPEGALPAGTTVGWQAFTGTGGTTYALSRTYEYPDRTLAVAATYRKEADVWKVQSININVQIKAGTPAPVEPAPSPANAV
jgi:hypothetical protein